MSEAPKSNYTLPVLLALFLCIGLWLGSELSKPLNKFANSNAAEVQKLEDILSLLDSRYVDKINKDSIFENTISEMLHKLDPHSNYIAAKDMKAVNESINAKFVVCLVYCLAHTQVSLLNLTAFHYFFVR